MKKLKHEHELDRKSTRLNSSHTVIYTLSLHDALPIFGKCFIATWARSADRVKVLLAHRRVGYEKTQARTRTRSEEHTSELQSHSDLHSFPTRRSSDLWKMLHRDVGAIG